MSEAKKTPADWVKLGSAYDCTTLIGPLHGADKEPEWPMYSYERPAYMLWNAIAGQLNKRGWSDEEIKAWLQSKETRWALDGDLGDLISQIGTVFAANATKLKASQ